jgi:hypothetical protein
MDLLINMKHWIPYMQSHYLCGTKPAHATWKLFFISCGVIVLLPVTKLYKDPVDTCTFVLLIFQEYYLTTLVRTDLGLDSLEIKYYSLSNRCLCSRLFVDKKGNCRNSCRCIESQYHTATRHKKRIRGFQIQ